MSAPAVPLPSRYKVLFIEDDPEDARLVKRMLKKIVPQTMDLVWVATLEEAIESADETQYDAVLIDFYLGGSTAVSFLGNKPRNLARSAFVMLTGRDADLIEEISYDLGIDFYVTKENLDARILERAVRYAIRNKEQQNRMGDFSRILAHDLRSPVGQTGQCLALARESLLADPTEPVLDLIDMAENSCSRALQILSDLQEYSLAQAGTLLTEKLSLDQLVDEVLESLSSYLQEKNAKVEKGELGNIQVDRRVFPHVVQNLVQNGIKYNESAQPIVTIEQKDEEHFVLVSFSDNGIGIPDDSYKVIFQPLARLTTKKKYEGTGFGLSACKEIVERHGGSIWVQSNEPEVGGSTFYLRIPKR